LITAIVDLEAIGKQNVVSCFPEGIYHKALGVNAVAMVYPQDKIPELAEWIHNNTQPLDFTVEDVANNHRWKTLLLVPNIAQHVGYWSSSSTKVQGDPRYLQNSRSFLKIAQEDPNETIK
jgi:hypothetical protein